MRKVFLHLGALLSAVIAQDTYTISSDHKTLEYWKEDCVGKRRMGMRIHDLFFEEKQPKKLSFPEFCCSDYYIIFSNSSIPTLTTSSFGTRPTYIVDMMLNNTNISKILPNTFNGLDHLNCLDLSNNKLGVIGNETFSGLKRLHILNLSNNEIQLIHNDSFKGIALEKIYLQNNMISFLGDSVFSFQKVSLSVIDLSRNVLTKINNIFTQMTSLDKIDLSHNNIEMINISSINCIIMYLRNNSITETGAIAERTRILDFNNNNLKSIEVLGSTFIDSLILKLNLGRNEIELNDNSLVGLNNLTHLHLDNNKIKKISNILFRNLKSLIFLDISHNNIVQFTYGTFDHLKNLQFLNLSHNEFTQLQSHVLSPVQKLSELDIRNNRIDKLDIKTFFYHCSGVKKIDLDGNFWKCKDLTNVVTYCQSKSIEVVGGSSTDLENVRGIQCYNDDFLSKSNSNPKNSAFLDFLKKDFEKSHFYEYFKKYGDGDSLNDSLLNFFNEEYNPNDLIKYFKNLRLHNGDESESSSENVIYGLSLFVLVLIFITVFTMFVLMFVKNPFKLTRNINLQENVEL
ncbi:uncharacterized protein [Leptinotarsa decemlineata]|uniref:uncharacterized protein n=1 Tax=Leptinotarsa decemlineata TaxID=7539 RepID=UPI003D309F4F